jgi:hypothetical protein
MIPRMISEIRSGKGEMYRNFSIPLSEGLIKPTSPNCGSAVRAGNTGIMTVEYSYLLGV